MSEKPRVTGGIVLGWKGKRPMAIAEEPDMDVSFGEPEVIYSAVPQICGFPWRTSSNGIYSIGPITGPQTGILASEIRTPLSGTDGTGVRVYLKEYYQESVVLNGATYAWGGSVVGGTAEIVIRDYSNETDENVVPSLNNITGAVTPATIMWQVAIVRRVNGEYYLCNSLIPPDDGAPYDRVFPDEFDIVNPL